MKNLHPSIWRSMLVLGIFLTASFCTKPHPDQGRSTDTTNSTVNFSRDTAQVERDSINQTMPRDSSGID